MNEKIELFNKSGEWIYGNIGKWLNKGQKYTFFGNKSILHLQNKATDPHIPKEMREVYQFQLDTILLGVEAKRKGFNFSRLRLALELIEATDLKRE